MVAILSFCQVDLPNVPKRGIKNKTGENITVIQNPLTPAQLYKSIPQYRDKNYTAKVSIANVIFVMVKGGWLEQHEDDMTDAAAIVSTLHPNYEAIIKTVPSLLNIDLM